MKNIIYILIATLVIVSSCKNDDEGTTKTFGNVVLDLKNTINSNGIELTTDSYTNGSNEVYIISELKYIISNVVLIKANGEEFTYPVDRSYFLINEEVLESKKVNLSDISAGQYTKIRFGFGVDQSKYPLNGMANFIPTAEESGMLWSWSAGYKFLKFEGTYTTNGGASTDFLIHVGSHGTTLDNYKEITLELPSTLTIEESKSPEVAINVDIAKIFDGTNTHSLEVKNSIQVDAEFAPKIAENISTMFTASSVSN
ncbi:MbnP family protein [Aquimarina macrocephali]|uniref:MbnP family protein n=1 Tax=Aquimarina macrocephali TaxID=666563 RepID=UPI0004640C7E|nr:MbnP family protein [Aquimarina macrocephali]